MFPLFGDKPTNRRREINLGGAHSATSYTDILNEAKAKREQRQELKRRQDSAIRIQTWWRGISQVRFIKRELRRLFEQDITGIEGLRCLILIGQDQDALGRWSTAIVNSKQDHILRHPEQSWFICLRKTSLLLLQDVANEPQSQYAVAHLAVLNMLLSDGPHTSQYIMYLLERGFYSLLGQAISQIPLESKASPTLPPLVSLLILPLFKAELHQLCLRELLIHIFSIPLLPNRLPLQSLIAFSARLPLTSLQTSFVYDIISSSPLRSPESRIHVLANLTVFAPPRYSTLPSTSFDAYLQLAAALMNSLPTHALEPPEDKQDIARHWADDDESDEESPTLVTVVTSFEPRPQLPRLDSRTRTRLQALPSVQHLNALLTAAQTKPSRLSLIAFCFALTIIWPSRRDKVLSTVAAFNGGGIVRELYRLYVRNSPLGRDERSGAVMDPENAETWSPLLFLVDMYTQALLTMGDDEFFSSGTSAGTPRNPLSLDEIVSFSRQLLNIAFVLYWREDTSNIQEGSVPGLGNLKWENVREKVTKCLQAIHARDSRRPFTHPGHWLVTSQVDMVSFIQAAVFEERTLAQPEGRPLSKRQVAYMSPRLGVLNNIPFAIPFETRVSIFRHFIANDMLRRGVDVYGRSGQTRITVRRGMVAEDGFDKLGDVDLHAHISITFVDRFGQEEAGIDGGGVFKEFLTSLCKEVFDTNRGLWQVNEKNELYPHPHSYATEPHSLNWYHFIGRILGKALYEGILVDIAFAGFFLAKWLGKQSFLDDLASLDPDLYQGLIKLKHYPGDPEDLSLSFAVTDQEFDVTKTTDLIPNGSNIAVTRENKLQYIYLISHYRLSKQIKLQSEAFFEGLSEMIDPKWLRMFNQQELQVLVGGVDSPIDLDDLRANTQYGGLYDDHEPTIEIFWGIVNAFKQDQRRALLRFVTSCSRPPLLGFKELKPRFAIRDAGSDQNRLPTASTCVNLLKLPRYSSEHILRDKLLQAINANAGFDLS
ncbi:hypothetical protein AcV5_007383 [Taiwanofungus camphoratus]|nr:hypothetical protein AcV5_007383 [Antrodia cinnamomea]